MAALARTPDTTGVTRSATRPLDIIGIVGAVAVAALILALPTPEQLAPAGHRVAALFGAALVLWVTEALPVGITALLVIACQPLLGINPLPVAITNFMNMVFFFLLVMFAVALAWTHTGLARRFSLWVITQAGTDAKRVIVAFMVGTGLVSTVMSDVPAAAMFMAVAQGLFERMRLQPGRSQFGRAVMLGIPIASYIGGIATPAGSSVNVLGLSMLEKGGVERVSFLSWMAIGVPMVIILLPLAAYVIVTWFPPEFESIGHIDDVREDLRSLGPVSPAEWKLIVIMGGMIACWILSTWYPAFDILLVGIAGVTVMFLPGVKLLTWQQVQQGAGWDAMFMAGGVISLGIASSSTGLAKWLVGASVGGLQDSSVLTIVVATSALAALGHLLIPVGPALVAVLVPSLIALAAGTGHNPALFALPAIFSVSCAFQLPLDPVALVTYGKGYYRMRDMLFPGLILTGAWVLVLSALFVLVSPLLGWR